MKKNELLKRLRAQNGKRPYGAFFMLLFFTLFLNVQSVNAQELTISGTVTDDAGIPLPGASVLVKGTNNGTQTNFDGNYSISVGNDATTLVISFLGFSTQEVAIAGQSIIDAQLAADTSELDEVVVIGYGTQKKSNITGAVANMSTKGLKDRPVNRLDQALVGQMAGVRVKQTSGVPGAGFNVQIRGTGSIGASSEPLYVIDGFPLEVTDQASNNINPNDIESIQVLKDAAAASIYGSRGANGVVLITTKKGKSGKAQISFNTYTGWSETAKKLDILSSEEWIDRAIEHTNYFYVRDYGSSGATSSHTNDERRAIIGVASGEYNTKYMPDERWSQPGHPGLDYVDWQDEFFRKGMVQSYQLSASGGNDTTKYYISGDYLDQEGIAVGVGMERFSARANIEIQPSKKVKFGLNLAPSFSTVYDPDVEGKGRLMHEVISMVPIVESDAGYLNTNVGDFSNYAWNRRSVSPIAVALERDRKTKRFRNIASAFFEYEIIDGLKYKTSVNLDWQNSKLTDFKPSFVHTSRRAEGYQEGSTTTAVVNEHTLNYSKSIDDHSFNILAGFSYNSFNFEGYSMKSKAFASDDVPTFNGASAIESQSTASKNVLISYFGRAQYSFKDKYLLQASIRRDGSSRFGDDTKWGVFPSVSLGWILSKESFMQEQNLFNNLKLRASWGEAGNNNIGNYEHIALLNLSNYSFGGSLANGQVPSNFPNPNLSWETSETIDVGIDFGILKNKIYGSFDYYTKRNTDLLLNTPVPSASGFSTALTNIGEVLNKGWEVELGTRNKFGELQWNVNANLSHNTNEVIKLGPNNTPILGGSFDLNHNILEVGRPMFTHYLVQQDGLLTTDDINNNVPMYGNQEAGDPKYVDINNDGTIDGDDRTYSGDAAPDYTWGITNTFTYKGFDLSVFLQGQWGGHIYSTFGRAVYRTGMGYQDNALGIMRDRYVWQEGVNVTAADLAGKVRKSPSSFGRIKSTDWQYSNDYWRIRNITLGYDLGRLLKTDVITGARIYIAAENWFGGDKYYGGFNPEAVNSNGDDYGAFPLSKSITMGLNLKL